MCGPHAAVRNIVGQLIEGHSIPTVVDIEAGLEHLSRGTTRHVDQLLVIVEPYFKSMETGARMCELASELEIPRVGVVANKCRSEEDLQAIEKFCQTRKLDLVGSIPDDESVLRADRQGVSPLDLAPESKAVRAIRALADSVTEWARH